MKRRVLHLDPPGRRWWLETLASETLAHDPREDYGLLSGEALYQYLLRRDPACLAIARGPMPFLAGNKATVGYLSPSTGLPHYSIVGGRSAAQLFYLGLDVICLHPSSNAVSSEARPYVVIRGRAPELEITFGDAQTLPSGQRSAYYWLVERELSGDAEAGSIFTLGEAARLGYHSANIAVEAIYHAGRGGAGLVLARHASALVLQGQPASPGAFFGKDVPLARNPNGPIVALLEQHCGRLSGSVGGTVTKLYATGAHPRGRHTLPSDNARSVGYALADLGSPRILKAIRQGHTGCHWCPVDCRHWHRVPADYASQGHDLLLDDFEPTYAIYAMLGLRAGEDTLSARLELLAEVDRRVMLPIEEMGADVISVGTGLASLFEGIREGVIPVTEAPEELLSDKGDISPALVGSLIALLRSPEAARYPALIAAAHGPQALAERYPPMHERVFTSGAHTLGNAGHSNALWTFLMPFSRFFGHYVGQLYKIEVELPPPGVTEEDYRACFRTVVRQALQREYYWILGNALSLCSFTFVIFSQDGAGERLSDDDLLVRLLRQYGLNTTRTDLEWFTQAFWAQSMALKQAHGWRPPTAQDFPRRVYESLSLSLERDPHELQRLMALLIDEWKALARERMARYGYLVDW